ncbi:MAG TPA: hypothetical protein VNG71_04970 [Pyrinomonadaceae bacterium]|nr:hypothetical protein [Pyrinomonadaceae bacterium]
MIETYDKLADLLEYPNSDWDSRIMFCADNEGLTKFRSRVDALTLTDLQELYTRTFDLNPVCALEIGYHLFGENYKRGEFLANLHRTEEPFDLGQEHQLPDYLPVLLRLLTRLDDEELRAALISECMTPALEKMLKALGDSENPYRHLLVAIDALLQKEPNVYPSRSERVHLPVMQTPAFSAGTNPNLF